MSFQIYIHNTATNQYYQQNPNQSDALNQQITIFDQTINEIRMEESDQDFPAYNLTSTQNCSFTTPCLFTIGALVTAIVTHSSLACCLGCGTGVATVTMMNRAIKHWERVEKEAVNKVQKLITVESLPKLTALEQAPELTQRAYVIDINIPNDFRQKT